MIKLPVAMAGTIAALMLMALAAGCADPPPPPAPPPECESNADCPEGKACQSGKCVKDATLAAKAKEGMCMEDADCPDPKICRDKQCVYECSVDSDCEAGYGCQQHRCVEGMGKCDTSAIFFDFDQSYLTTDGQERLRTMAQCLSKKKPTSVKIEGYCDERGTDEYNLALGDKRAKAIKKYLLELGLSPKLIKTVSFGEEYAKTCEAEDCWQRDRKGEFKVTEE